MFDDANATVVWNRAGDALALDPLPGDEALEEMQLFHGLVMNGGLLHALESFGEQYGLDAAQASYRYFGLDAVADLIGDVSTMPEAASDTDPWRYDLTKRYLAIVADDTTLMARLKITLRTHPSDFAPV